VTPKLLAGRRKANEIDGNDVVSLQRLRLPKKEGLTFRDARRRAVSLEVEREDGIGLATGRNSLEGSMPNETDGYESTISGISRENDREGPELTMKGPPHETGTPDKPASAQEGKGEDPEEVDKGDIEEKEDSGRNLRKGETRGKESENDLETLSSFGSLEKDVEGAKRDKVRVEHSGRTPNNVPEEIDAELSAAKEPMDNSAVRRHGVTRLYDRRQDQTLRNDKPGTELIRREGTYQDESGSEDDGLVSRSGHWGQGHKYPVGTC
jgi:hypothetical protein